MNLFLMFVEIGGNQKDAQPSASAMLPISGLGLTSPIFAKASGLGLRSKKSYDPAGRFSSLGLGWFHVKGNMWAMNYPLFFPLGSTSYIDF